MSGVFAGLVASVKAGSIPEPTNLVANPSFTINGTGWIEAVGNSIRDTSVFKSSPASLNTFFDGDNNPYAYYVSTSALTVGQMYSLSLWINNPIGSPTRRFDVGLNCGTNGKIVKTASISPSTTWVYVKVENVLCTGSGTFSVFVTDGEGTYPAAGFNIDDVSVVLGATAL
jgi:hypothetical protein